MEHLLNKVHCMDALELMRMIPDGSVDAVITDPPYGLAGRVFEFPHKKYSAVNESWDTFAPVEWMAECKRVLKPSGNVVCFGVRQSIYTFAGEGFRLGWRLVNDITWVKPDAAPNFTGRMLTEATERVLWFSPFGSKWYYALDDAKSLNGGINFRDVWTFNTERGERYHPTQKPLALIKRAVELFCPRNGVVVDPFAGSGTTALAAAILGRRFIVGDTSSEYCTIARKRLEAYTPDMFEVFSGGGK